MVRSSQQTIELQAFKNLNDSGDMDLFSPDNPSGIDSIRPSGHHNINYQAQIDELNKRIEELTIDLEVSNAAKTSLDKSLKRTMPLINNLGLEKKALQEENATLSRLLEASRSSQSRDLESQLTQYKK